MGGLIELTRKMTSREKLGAAYIQPITRPRHLADIRTGRCVDASLSCHNRLLSLDERVAARLRTPDALMVRYVEDHWT